MEFRQQSGAAIGIRGKVCGLSGKRGEILGESKMRRSGGGVAHSEEFVYLAIQIWRDMVF